MQIRLKQAQIEVIVIHQKGKRTANRMRVETAMVIAIETRVMLIVRQQ